jgi:signal transduction histidine kinase
VRLGLRLRARAQALRRRAAFEHVIAESSTHLINCPAEETGSQLKQVLGAFCRGMGIDRAYVVLDDKPTRVISWCREGSEYPPGWPEQAMRLAERLGATGPDIVAVPDIDALPPGEVRDALAAAGIHGWAFVPLVRTGQVRGILGFDAFGPTWRMVFPLPVVRLAADAVVNALEREFFERERNRLGARLERARRMQTIGQLASGIAHNFNNIIGAILGYAEMAEAQATPSTELAKHIDEIRRATERGRDLIDTILVFGRQSETRARPIPVGSLLTEAASLLHASLPGTTELTIEVSPPDLTVLGKPAQLQQIVLNLCNNASQAMEGRGCVRVTAEYRNVLAPLRLTHGELGAGRYVCLAVSDNGRGFDETVAPRLFEPFFTTRTGGTGLGLASVLEIIRDHDGAMNVQSELGLGSSFEAWLPALVEGDGAAFTSNDEPALPLGRGETVLIIENERERLLRDEEMVAALGIRADRIPTC